MSSKKKWDPLNPPSDPEERRKFDHAMNARKRRSDPEFKEAEKSRNRELRQEDIERFRDRDRNRATRARRVLPQEARDEISAKRRPYFRERYADEYAAWAARFGEVCWVCGREPVVDLQCEHCHATGLPRGLAHKGCNLVLRVLENFFRDRAATESEMIAYVAESGISSKDPDYVLRLCAALEACVALRVSHGFMSPEENHPKPPKLSTTPLPKKVSMSKAPRKERQCSNCMGFGHNHRTCTK